MGIIIKQSIKGSIWSYLGVAVGFVTTAYLFPNYLTTDTIGLFSILLSYSILFAQFSGLGFHGITNRLFPYFRNKEKSHNGYLFIAFTVMLIGLLLFILFFFSLKSFLIESNLEKSKLFTEYINLLIPITFFSLLFLQLDIYNKLLYDAVLGTFLQEFLQRILIFSVTVLYVFNVITLNQLILAYAASVCVKGLVIFIHLLLKNEISLKPQLKFIDSKLRKEMVSVAIFSILTGFGGSLVFNIDKILVNQILGLGQTGVYTIAFFFGTLVVIPSRPLLRISGTLIADGFKKNDLNFISRLYKKSCLNQIIIGAFLFGGIWINIDNILIILGPEYFEAKWVIFFIGIAYLVDMFTGANGHIIAYSKYYRVSFYFIALLIVLVVGTIFLLVPIWGITGAAVAIAVSIFTQNLMRFLFLKRKYNMQPFTWKIILILLLLVVLIFLIQIIPAFNFLLVDIFIRSIIFTTIYAFCIIYFRFSEEIDDLFVKLILFISKKQK